MLLIGNHMIQLIFGNVDKVMKYKAEKENYNKMAAYIEEEINQQL